MEIVEMRKLLGLSQAKFAKKYDIPKRTIENWESGKNKCPEYLRELLEKAVKEDMRGKEKRDATNKNPFDAILDVYDKLGVEEVIPIAHIRIRPDIGILLDDNGNFLGAMINRDERCSIPCTIDSESRTSGIAPHPIHDNMTYLCGDYPKYKERHTAYMQQLEDYVNNVDDKLAKSVWLYLQKDTIRYNISQLSSQIKDTSEEKLMIVFATLTHPNTISKEWTDYYLSSLPKNGICSITGIMDHIPDKYPKGIRYPSDMAKLFIATPKKLDSMPTIAPGYIASQKIIHTMQFITYEGESWVYSLFRNEDNLSAEYNKWLKKYTMKHVETV